MSVREANQFVDQIATDTELQTAVQQHAQNTDSGIQAILSVGREEGYEFSEAEIETAIKDLICEDLEREAINEDGPVDCPTVCPMSTLMTA